VDDVAGILAALNANRGDSSLFQQPEHQVKRTLGDFFVAHEVDGTLCACAALHWHAADNAEILAVAVLPQVQGRGVGRRLMQSCLDEVNRTNAGAVVWLATAKPEYFARFGFHPLSRFRLPASVLWTKFRLIFQQPPSRWLPALLGRHTFMVHAQRPR
jgi:N-acetylglutamate synthase-like GNAT family acetyltransferase